MDLESKKPIQTSRRDFLNGIGGGFTSLAMTGMLSAAEPKFPGDAQRVLFLGDSITHAGHYVEMIEAHVRTAHPNSRAEFINLGLPSETCSGLSEPEHPFPRPNVHERLDRALARIQPDLVVACYYPFSEERFAAYQRGIRTLVAKVKQSGARLVLMSPPAFDPLPLKKKGSLLPLGAEKYAWFKIYEGYDDVLRKYAAWVIQPQPDVVATIDLHTAVHNYVAKKRRSDPDFTMSNDGVHVNVEGHRVLADAILTAWGYDPSQTVNPELAKLVSQRQRITHPAYVSYVEHQRPGVKAGLPIEEARAAAAKIEAQITTLLNRSK